MPRPRREYFVLVPSTSPHQTSMVWGPFRDGVRKGESPRVVAEKFAVSRGGTVLGPFDPMKAPKRERAMDDNEPKTPNNAGMIDHMLRELEQPAKMLHDWEKDFLYSIRDQFNRRGWLSDRQFDVLERIYAERTA